MCKYLIKLKNLSVNLTAWTGLLNKHHSPSGLIMVTSINTAIFESQLETDVALKTTHIYSPITLDIFPPLVL